MTMKPMGFLRCACLALALGGCLALGGTQDTRFYVLTPLTDGTTAAQPMVASPKARQRLSVGLAPVDVPRYLDRPQIVTRVTSNELSLSEFDQWAEPLPDSIAHVLAENLTRLLSMHGMDVLSESRASRSDYYVGVVLQRFECEADDGCVLQARWTLVGERDQARLVQNAFEVRMPLEGGGYEAMVGAMSRALGALSRDIALHLRAVMTHRGTG
jgi:uncharacterized lipoprotein YmbA